MVTHVTMSNAQQEIEASKLPIVLDVYASWCGPCQMMEPIFVSLEKEMGSEYKFLKLNVDEARDLSIKFGVTSVPTIIFIKNNEIKGRETGYMDKDELKNRIVAYLR